jgi:hypothetical protein
MSNSAEAAFAIGIAALGVFGFLTCERETERPAHLIKGPSLMPWRLLMIFCLGIALFSLALFINIVCGAL